METELTFIRRILAWNYYKYYNCPSKYFELLRIIKQKPTEKIYARISLDLWRKDCMKKIFAALMFLTLGFIGIQSAQAYEPWGVGIYNGTKEAMDYATPGATLGRRTGSATCQTILGIVNWGDCSIRTAMKNGGISKVTAADWEKRFVLIYGEKTLRVYGN